MDVYLVRHADAVSEEQDPERPLSPAGRETAERLARHVASLRPLLEPPIAEVLHSGKRRAEQTAAIFAAALSPTAAPTVASGLKPNDEPRPIAKMLEKRRREDSAIMLVGHLPHLERLTGLLVAGDAECAVVRFEKSALLKLVPRESEPGWTIAAYLTPACAPP